MLIKLRSLEWYRSGNALCATTFDDKHFEIVKEYHSPETYCIAEVSNDNFCDWEHVGRGYKTQDDAMKDCIENHNKKALTRLKGFVESYLTGTYATWNPTIIFKCSDEDTD